jgi:asparagine synthase (glutamine-hydrolysing)
MLSPRRDIDRRATRRGIEALSHRGRDWNSAWVSASGRAALASTDVDSLVHAAGRRDGAGDPPRFSGVLCGQPRITMSRRELERLGIDDETPRPDAVLVLYAAFGPAALEYLAGSFAIAIWDDHSGALFAAADRCGARELHYAEHDGSLFVASEAKALFAAGVPARWDATSLFDSIQGALPRDSTLYAGVQRIACGQYLIADETRRDVVRYWDVAYPPETGVRSRADTSEPEWIDRLHDALDEAVVTALDGAPRAAFAVSGGLDSLALMALAAPHARAPRDAFTFCYPEAGHNELASAQRTCDLFGDRLHAVEVTPDRVAACFAEAVAAAEAPSDNLRAVAKYLLAGLVREHGHDRLVTGVGADGSFGHDYEVSLAADATAHPLLGFIPNFVRRRRVYLDRFLSIADPDWLDRLRDRDSFGVFLSRLPCQRIAARSALHQSLYVGGRSEVATNICGVCNERVLMARGVASVSPFLDHRVAELAAAMPTSLLVAGGREKHALRLLLARLMPVPVPQEPKLPPSPPLALPHGSPIRALLFDLLSSAAVRDVPCLDPGAVTSALAEVASGGPELELRWSPVLLFAAGLCVLQTRFSPT